MKIFDPARESAEQFCNLSPADREALREDGYRFEGLKVVRFLDTLESSPWFYRRFDMLGYVFSVTDGGAPIDSEMVLKTARETFGACDVLW